VFVFAASLTSVGEGFVLPVALHTIAVFMHADDNSEVDAR
jgi:hypothetical protein